MIDDPTFWMAVIDRLPATGGTMINQDGAMMCISRYPLNIWIELKTPITTGRLLPIAADALLGEWCINRCGWMPYAMGGEVHA
jgi:hypothetical protein